MMDDDDDDFLSFDDNSDDDGAAVPTNCLVVGPRLPNAEMLNKLEAAYRRQGCPPVIFTAVDEMNGAEIFENPDTFHRAMGRGPDEPLPTLAEAEAWVADPARNWATFTW
jgi:hypothetical protein